MKNNHLIRLRHHEIDKAKWDAGIARSAHPLIYAESWYLDIVSPNWEAIVSNDYNTLWPLTLNRKYKWPLIVQPMFTQQLGIFSSVPIGTDETTRMWRTNPYPIHTMQSHAQYQWSSSYHLTTKNNAVLPLQNNYTDLYKSFRKDRKQSLKRSLKRQTAYHYQTSASAFIDYTQKNNHYHLAEKHLETLHQLISRALALKNGFIITVEDELQEPLSMAFFLKKFNRITNLSGHSSSKGYAWEGMFLILNQVIQDYAGSEYLLDFEGSELKGVASFYRSFGAINEPYQCIQNPMVACWQKFRKGLGKKNS